MIKKGTIVTAGQSYRSDRGIALGADAGLVVLDPDRKVTLRRDKLRMNVGHSP